MPDPLLTFYTHVGSLTLITCPTRALPTLKMTQYTHILTALRREFPAPPIKPVRLELIYHSHGHRLTRRLGSTSALRR